MVWLEYHKEKWKMQKRMREERKRLLTQQNGVGGALSGDFLSLRGVGGATGDLTGFLRQQNRALIDLPWEIIQVCSIM